MTFEKYKNENGIQLSESIKDNLKSSIKAISKDNKGQGAAEYILLFGGVIVIALAGLLIYRSYFSNNASGLNATQDISSIRNNVSMY
jgi:uncharacterized protein (UPF0333 family)